MLTKPFMNDLSENHKHMCKLQFQSSSWSCIALFAWCQVVTGIIQQARNDNYKGIRRVCNGSTRKGLQSKSATGSLLMKSMCA